MSLESGCDTNVWAIQNQDVEECERMKEKKQITNDKYHRLWGVIQSR